MNYEVEFFFAFAFSKTWDVSDLRKCNKQHGNKTFISFVWAFPAYIQYIKIPRLCIINRTKRVRGKKKKQEEKRWRKICKHSSFSGRTKLPFIFYSILFFSLFGFFLSTPKTQYLAEYLPPKPQKFARRVYFAQF